MPPSKGPWPDLPITGLTNKMLTLCTHDCRPRITRLRTAKNAQISNCTGSDVGKSAVPSP